MKSKIVVLSVAWLAVSAKVVLACSCARLGPVPCGKFSPTNVVFVGTVESIENPPPDFKHRAESGVIDQGGHSRYHFRIDEKFSDTPATEIDVFSGRGGGDCSYHFRQGEQYLVFPYESKDGKLWATICSDTQPAEFASAKLAVLRAMRDHKPVPSLYGSLRRVEQPYGSVTADYHGEPIPDTRMILRSDENVIETKTDTNGNYQFFDVPGGKYQVEADLPQHFEIAETILNTPVPPIDLPQNACYEHDVTVLPTGRIRGRVFGPDGNALPYASVELFRPNLYAVTEGPPMLGWSESQNERRQEFVFEHVAAGDYILVYNNQQRVDPFTPFPRMFYPGVTEQKQAQIIHLDEGQDLAGLEFKLSGGRATRAVIVRLVAASKELPNISYIEARGEDGSTVSEQELAPGVFRILVFPGITYEMRGTGYCSATREDSKTAAAVVDRNDTSSNELVLTFPGPGCPKKSENERDSE